MRMIGIPRVIAQRALLAMCVLWFSGCSLLPQEEGSPAPVVVEPEAETAAEPPQPETTAEPSSRVPTPPPLPTVAIIVSGEQSAYADVANELAANLDNYDVYDLSDGTRPPVSVLRLVNDSNAGVVVAIGLRAALSSVSMSEKPVVFAQVFNHQDHGLLNDNSRGVSAIAPLDAQLAAWKEVDPELARVGVIIGEGHDDLVAEAELAAERHGVDLQIHISRSDQETLYFFRRMVRDIDGFWLFPDNRILSRRALHEIMEDAQHRQVRVLAPNDSMLGMGASISVTSVAADIAATITRIVRQIEAGNLALVPPITPLSDIRVRTSGAVRVVER